MQPDFAPSRRVLKPDAPWIPTIPAWLSLLLVLIFILIATSGPATAQQLSIDLGESDGSLTLRSLQLIALVTVLSIAPGLAIMLTCFPFIVTVLSILRQGLGLQQSPPNMLIISLALFLTYFIMDPVFRAAWDAGIDPMVQGRLTLEQGLPLALEPFRGFMSGRTDPDTLQRLALLRVESVGAALPQGDTAPWSILVPSFLLSEIERAFQIGFLIFLPFLVIDLVVAAILMSMGMMMVPPSVVALPFKLAFFVVADGWTLVSEALLRNYLG